MLNRAQDVRRKKINGDLNFNSKALCDRSSKDKSNNTKYSCFARNDNNTDNC